MIAPQKLYLKKLPKSPPDTSFMHKENLRQQLKENKVHSATIIKKDR